MGAFILIIVIAIVIRISAVIRKHSYHLENSIDKENASDINKENASGHAL